MIAGRRLERPTLFNYTNGFFLILAGTICVLPMLHVLAQSFSSENAILSGRVGIVPVEAHIKAYKAVIQKTGMVDALLFTAYMTILGTSINVLITALAAYPLSKRNLVGKRVIWFFILFTMFFGGGLIPLFLVVRSLGLLDTVWALILPGTISTFNLILMKTYFQGIPDSLSESARMDGCSELSILFRIVIPVSMPIIATLTLFYGVGHWNEYFQALIYITDPKKYTLQLRLQQLVIGETSLQEFSAGEFASSKDAPVESLKSAAIIFATVPILLVFPYLQKYFVKGALLGSLKQ